MTDRPHWSYSAVNQYLRCPLQFYLERVARIPQESVGSSLVLGSAVHAALETYHRGLQQRHHASAEELQAAFLNKWQWREREMAIAYRSGESRDDCIAQGIHLVKLYVADPPPSEVIAVERELVVPLHNSRGKYLETPLVTVIDLLARENGRLKILEIKTSGRSYAESDSETSLQPACYVNAVREEYGEEATVEFVVLVKTKTPKIQRVSTFRNEDDLGRLGDLVEAVEHAVRTGVFYPNENPRNCSTCSYRTPCRQWGTSGFRQFMRNRPPALVEVGAC